MASSPDPLTAPSTAPPGRLAHRAAASRAAAGWRQGKASASRVLDLLERLVPLANRVAGVVRVLSRVAIGAAVILVVCLAVLTTPSTIGAGLALALVAVILAVPAIVLTIFKRAICEVQALPEWLRSSPEMMKTHGKEIAGIVARGQAENALGAPKERRRIGTDLFRTVKLLIQAHGSLPEYGTALALINPLFLIATGISLAVLTIEVIATPFAVTAALVSLVL